VLIAAPIEEGLGAVAMLLTAGDAARMAASVTEGDPEKETLDDGDLDALKEMVGGALGGGAAALAEGAGHSPVTMGTSEAAQEIEAAIGIVEQLLGDAPAGAEIAFQGGGFDSRAWLLWSEQVESLAGGVGGADDGPDLSLSPDEVGDILSGFDSGANTAGGGDDARMSGPLPENLDMVLDIRPVATARMGRVDIPLREVLHYGPGSIIELDKLVDEPVELIVNDKLIARGDVVVVDEKFGLPITEIVSKAERIESLR